MTVDVLIPVLDEERSIGKVIGDLPRERLRTVVVVDNGCRDRSPQIAGDAGAVVVKQPQRGYGAACLAGIAHLRDSGDPPEILVFLDGDYSDFPEELPQVIAPIERGDADLVIGSRLLGNVSSDGLLPHTRFGNWLAGTLIRLLYGVKTTDLGPFRAIRWDALMRMQMEDEDFGWTVEMQAKAARLKMRYVEVPVSYRPRIGTSKITGTLSGSIKAAIKIAYTMVKLRYASFKS